MSWDYLIVTASNELQAAAYRKQLEQRKRVGLLHGFDEVLVVADPNGQRIGSGGSTITCLLQVLQRERRVVAARSVESESCQPADETGQSLFSKLRILIIHAGGDSQRLPAYGACGKIFVPLPGDSDSPVATTLFDRQLPVYRDLPAPPAGRGQVVIASGDVLLGFSPEEVTFGRQGITGLACAASPEEASRHGVYCPGPDRTVRRFLQKPSVDEQRAAGAVDAFGRSLLDIGVIEFDGETAARLLQWASERDVVNQPPISCLEMEDLAFAHALDFYREICCAVGGETSFDSYWAAVQGAGTEWPRSALQGLYEAVSSIRCEVQVLSKCSFLHFGTTGQIISSGQELVREGNGLGTSKKCLIMNSHVAHERSIATVDGWIEGCRLDGEVALEGHNVLVGVDEAGPLELPRGACLDLLPGVNRTGQSVSFVRCYCQDDSLNGTSGPEATLCQWPLRSWLESAAMPSDDLWDSSIADEHRTVWRARLFPAVDTLQAYRHWLWMFTPQSARPDQWEAWRQADRYSLAEMAELADLEAFASRRINANCEMMGTSLRHLFRHNSEFSAAELTYVLERAQTPYPLVEKVLSEAHHHANGGQMMAGQGAFVVSRILHSLGTAMMEAKERLTSILDNSIREVEGTDVQGWLAEQGLAWRESSSVRDWAERAQGRAFELLRDTIVTAESEPVVAPRSVLRRDEIVWGRIPARLDLAGGWTDTPPYSLENGGSVLNAAVLLNGQPPIQVYARMTERPIIRLRSIDVGSDVEIRCWDELLDYASATGEFSLAKAALAQCGFSPEAAGGPCCGNLQEALTAFGGGLELTTLAAIPKGSGLGTSSIMGTVILAVIHRVLGTTLSPNNLFHRVLRLEQALTTGGGWQDQIGGAAGGLKLVSTEAALVPDATIRYLPSDTLDPKLNGGCTLLYYTGITRLAKNILQQVVGRYLNRDREAMAVLRRLHGVATEMAEVISKKDIAEFGRLVDQVWSLNKQLDPNSTTREIEDLLDRARPHIWGAKLLGAGGGGFLLLICRSPEAANRVRTDFDRNPPNNLARFFDFAVSNEGLQLSTC